LTALTGANSAPGDLLTIVDVSDTTMDAAGTNKSITRQELQTYNAGTLTTDVKVLDLSATWNGGAVTFTGLKFNVTDTASAAASKLLDLQVGGNPIFGVRRLESSGTKYDRTVIIGTQYTYFTNATGGFYAFGENTATIGSCLNGNNVFVTSTGSFNWSSNSSNASSLGADLSLFRDAANTLAQRRATNAQTSNLYRTFTDASNYQRLTKTWSTSTAVIHNEGAGTSADGSIAFNDAALATDTTKGFIMIPSCAGAPTGTPADIPTGQIPIVFDSTNNKLYAYDGGWISTAALT
jgi:hypothetical protein